MYRFDLVYTYNIRYTELSHSFYYAYQLVALFVYSCIPFVKLIYTILKPLSLRIATNRKKETATMELAYISLGLSLRAQLASRSGLAAA